MFKVKSILGVIGFPAQNKSLVLVVAKPINKIGVFGGEETESLLLRNIRFKLMCYAGQGGF